MPYLGRDWRSPGDQWVRTTEGWEKLRLWRVKLFENLNENFLARCKRLGIMYRRMVFTICTIVCMREYRPVLTPKEDIQCDDAIMCCVLMSPIYLRLVRLALTDWSGRRENDQINHQPHIQYIKGTSREIKTHMSISEAFIRLDVSGAVRDIRRFTYVCSLLEVLITIKLPSLSGNTQKYIFHTLEDVLTQVLKLQYNMEAVRRLLRLSLKALEDGIHNHIGSQALWTQHKEAVDRMIDRLDAFQLTERENDGKLMFGDLPEDCIRDILLRLPDHRDIVHTGLTNSFIYDLSQEKLLWKQLCFYNFDNHQLLIFIPKHAEEDEVDWKMIYRRCVKRFGRKDTFADMLCMCSHCDCIFWKLSGHPCSKEDDAEPVFRPLTPEAFLSLFAL